MSKYKLTITDYPDYIQILSGGKTKKHYISANMFYSSPHWTIRAKIIEKMELVLIKNGLKPFIKSIKDDFLEKEIVISSIILSVTKPTKNWDVDNVGYFWLKILLDKIKGEKGFIKDDNVRFIP